MYFIGQKQSLFVYNHTDNQLHKYTLCCCSQCTIRRYYSQSHSSLINQLITIKVHPEWTTPQTSLQVMNTVAK